MRSRFLGLMAAAALLGAESQQAQRWWQHVVFLADDSLEGRDTGSEGHKKAARYIAQEFERTGLKPAGTSGYFQPVNFRSQSIDEAGSSLTLVFPDRSEQLSLGNDAYFGLRGNLASEVSAPMAFAGYGFAVPENNFDELAGLDLKGKIVVYLTGGPKDIPGPLLSHNQSAAERWQRAKAAGAIGFATIGNPKTSDIPWSRARLSRLLPSMKLVDLAMDGPSINLTINPEQANKFFAGSGHTIEELLTLADTGKPLPKFNLQPTLQAKLKLNEASLASDNVVAVKAGSDPKVKGEYVVFSAHLDHVGVGKHLTGDQIYNGAMDNAAGIATMIEVARELRSVKTRRSLLFVAVTGEEKGLLGSQYFADKPTVERKTLVADLNFDMFLPLFPLQRVIVYGMDESTLGDTVKAVAEKAGIEAMRDPEPLRNSFIRSDQYSFIKRGIPSLAFKLGYAPGSPEERIFKGWLKERYHAVSDDLQQPVDREAAAKFNTLMVKVATAVANGTERPRWNEKSFFRRFAE